MTVAELITELQKCDGDQLVYAFDAEWGPQLVKACRTYPADEQLRDNKSLRGTVKPAVLLE